MVREFRHHPLLKTALTAIRIRVSSLNFEERASMLEEATTTIPGEKGTIISPSPPEKEDVIREKTMHAMYDKSHGIQMVSPLLIVGQNLHMFVYTCEIFRLELPNHYSYP